MIPTIVNLSLPGLYTGGLSYFLQATALDQKVFNFTAPLFKHAFAFGVIFSLTRLTLETIVRDVTGTTVERGSEMGMTYKTFHSKAPLAYKIGNLVAKIISGLGSVYVLQQMNYSASYRFAGICAVPFLIKEIYEMKQQEKK